MASMIYQKRRGGTVKIYDQDVVEKVINIESEMQRASSDLKKFKRRPKKSDIRASSAPDSASTVSMDSKGLLSQSVRVQDWLNEKTIKELQEGTDHESQAAKKLYAPFLETESTFIKEIGDRLAYKELVDLRKKEVLHKRWSDQVYEPIRKKILEAIDGADWHHLDRRKREMHKQFLEHVNKRGFVFLEDDDREEYYAQALNGHRPNPIKIRTENLSDPLLTLSRQRSEEDRTIMRCTTGQNYSDNDLDQVRLPPLPLIPLGRHGINSCRWLEMPLTNIESPVRERSRLRMLGNSTKTDIDFAAWSKMGRDAKIVARELQIPRRKAFAEQPPYGKPPVEVPKVSFIDPEDFADKIINIDPFPEHRARIQAEAEELRAFYEQHQESSQWLMEEQHQQPVMVEN
ncbi:hypothetical protein EGW08_015228 [Elysia chlorotica]|uniref:Uncharacterized protein n=1 Tax=Elysia chlorotica TaxID=188477 RepID=A0A433T605_ELYCH|nr:hypothetical protein EGW08_015228 [Elysia chlorotica]